MTPLARSRLQLVAGAALFSTAGAAIKACALSSWQVAGFRAGVAALALLILIPSARRGLSSRAALVAVAYAATVVMFVHANKLTTAASTIFLQAATSPLYIVVLQPWLLRERVARRDVGALAALAAGLVLVLLGTPAPARSAPAPALGNLLAALSGVTCAFMMVGLRWLARGDTAGTGSAPAAVVLGNLFAFTSVLPLALPVSGARAADWGLIAYLGVFQIAIAYVLLLDALRHVPALEASLLLFVEPVLSPVWAWLFHHERPGSWALAGGAVILLTTAVRGWMEKSGPLRVPPPPE